MRCAVKLSDVHYIAFVFQHGCLIVVNVEVIRRREDRHDRREASGLSLAIHAVSVALSEKIPLRMNMTYPASWASCARMIERRLFLSRNWHAA